MSNKRAFSLIEILIVLAILGMLVGIGLPQVNRIFRTNLKSSAVKIAGLVRVAYDNAVVKSLVHRIVFDFDENTYHLELAKKEGPISIEDNKDLSKKGSSLFESETEEEEEDFLPFPGQHGEATKLPFGVVFDSLESVSLERKFTEGRAYIYFFPQGMTQDMIVRIKSERGETGFFSIMLNPINGRTRVEGRYIEAE